MFFKNMLFQRQLIYIEDSLFLVIIFILFNLFKEYISMLQKPLNVFIFLILKKN